MRVLHTADWHLGQRFQQGLERLEEHSCFLDWLLATIEQEQVDVLVVAGDIFDVPNPAAAARQLYYSFLARLQSSTSCHDVVIVGGNHDSAATLNASASLLKPLRVHVVGGVPPTFEDQCIRLPHGADIPRLVVVAVPFLRDSDVRHLVPGETAAERETRLRDGIATHYQRLADGLGNCRSAGIPVLATGHLFAAGGQAGDVEQTIHVGTLGQITADAFSDCFDYVALGHLHRPQIVGKKPHIRYSGAPVPLSFSETAHSQQVLLLTFQGATCPTIQALDVPCTRQLRRFRGSLEEVIQAIASYDNTGYHQEAWAEATVEASLPWALVQEQVREAWQATNGRVRVLVVRPMSLRTPTSDPIHGIEETQVHNLDELSPEIVFAQLLDTRNFELQARQDLLDTFAQLRASYSAEQVTADSAQVKQETSYFTETLA